MVLVNLGCRLHSARCSIADPRGPEFGSAALTRFTAFRVARDGGWAGVPAVRCPRRPIPGLTGAGTESRRRARTAAIWVASLHHAGGVRIGSVLAITVKVDPQGRVVIPQAERERLGLSGRGALELVSTPEGLLLERRRRATVTVDDSGLPLVTVDELDTVSNDTTVEAIHAQRDRE